MYYYSILTVSIYRYICSIMVSVLSWSVMENGFKSWSCQTKNYNVSICWFSAKHAALRSKSKDWLKRNQDNMCVSGATCLPVDCCCEWSNMSTCGLLLWVGQHVYLWTVVVSGATCLPVDCCCEWGDMSTCGLLLWVGRHVYLWTNTITIQLSMFF